jgi:hypothetical protein
VSREGGVLGSFPGRVTVQVRLPENLLVEAERLASNHGVDQAILLGDLVAHELPRALAAAAQEVLTANAATPPALTDGATHNLISQPQVVSVVPRDGRNHADDPDGTAT